MNKMFRIVRQNKLAVIGATLATAQAANAAIDITAATGGVSDAQTAVLGVLAVMITMAAAIFGIKKVLGLLNRGG